MGSSNSLPTTNTRIPDTTPYNCSIYNKYSVPVHLGEYDIATMKNNANGLHDEKSLDISLGGVKIGYYPYMNYPNGENNFPLFEDDGDYIKGTKKFYSMSAGDIKTNHKTVFELIYIQNRYNTKLYGNNINYNEKKRPWKNREVIDKYGISIALPDNIYKQTMMHIDQTKYSNCFFVESRFGKWKVQGFADNNISKVTSSYIDLYMVRYGLPFGEGFYNVNKWTYPKYNIKENVASFGSFVSDTLDKIMDIKFDEDAQKASGDDQYDVILVENDNERYYGFLQNILGARSNTYGSKNKHTDVRYPIFNSSKDYNKFNESTTVHKFWYNKYVRAYNSTDENDNCDIIVNHCDQSVWEITQGGYDYDDNYKYNGYTAYELVRGNFYQRYAWSDEGMSNSLCHSMTRMQKYFNVCDCLFNRNLEASHLIMNRFDNNMQIFNENIQETKDYSNIYESVPFDYFICNNNAPLKAIPYSKFLYMRGYNSLARHYFDFKRLDNLQTIHNDWIIYADIKEEIDAKEYNEKLMKNKYMNAELSSNILSYSIKNKTDTITEDYNIMISKFYDLEATRDEDSSDFVETVPLLNEFDNNIYCYHNKRLKVSSDNYIGRNLGAYIDVIDKIPMNGVYDHYTGAVECNSESSLENFIKKQILNAPKGIRYANSNGIKGPAYTHWCMNHPKFICHINSLFNAPILMNLYYGDNTLSEIMAETYNLHILKFYYENTPSASLSGLIQMLDDVKFKWEEVSNLPQVYEFVFFMVYWQNDYNDGNGVYTLFDKLMKYDTFEPYSYGKLIPKLTYEDDNIKVTDLVVPTVSKEVISPCTISLIHNLITAKYLNEYNLYKVIPYDSPNRSIDEDGNLHFNKNEYSYQRYLGNYDSSKYFYHRSNSIRYIMKTKKYEYNENVHNQLLIFRYFLAHSIVINKDSLNITIDYMHETDNIPATYFVSTNPNYNTIEERINKYY